MTLESVYDWVQCNAGAIINATKVNLDSSPYDRDDLIGYAHEAAIIAVFTSRESEGLMFEQAFWKIYRTKIREAFFYHDNHRSSQSVPSHFCVDIHEHEVGGTTSSAEDDYGFIHDYHSEQDIDAHDLESMTDAEGADYAFELGELSEQVFWASYEHLSQAEQRLLYKLLGLGKAGYHSLDEAGNKLGITEAAACTMLGKVGQKLSKLFELGLCSLDSQPPESAMRDFDTNYHALFPTNA